MQQLQWGSCEAVPGVPLRTEWWYIRESGTITDLERCIIAPYHRCRDVICACKTGAWYDFTVLYQEIHKIHHRNFQITPGTVLDMDQLEVVMLLATEEEYRRIHAKLRTWVVGPRTQRLWQIISEQLQATVSYDQSLPIPDFTEMPRPHSVILRPVPLANFRKWVQIKADGTLRSEATYYRYTNLMFGPCLITERDPGSDSDNNSD